MWELLVGKPIEQEIAWRLEQGRKEHGIERRRRNTVISAALNRVIRLGFQTTSRLTDGEEEIYIYGQITVCYPVFCLIINLPF